jgi:transposase
MSSVTRFVGLDYHQNSVQVCVMDHQGTVLVNRSVANRWRAMAGVLGETIDDESGPVSVRAAIELCSGAPHLAEELIEQTGWLVTLGHPGMVNRMKQNPDKSDKADAWILAICRRSG